MHVYVCIYTSVYPPPLELEIEADEEELATQEEKTNKQKNKVLKITYQEHHELHTCPFRFVRCPFKCTEKVRFSVLEAVHKHISIHTCMNVYKCICKYIHIII
jgi:hypothetical protein